MDRIFIENLNVQTVIGIYDWEREIKQSVSLDLEMEFDIKRAAQTDSIEDTLDYKAVCKRLILFIEDSDFQLVEALAEGLHFAEKVGLDVDRVIEVISQGAAGSWQMDNRATTMTRGHFDFGFAVDWMRKDLGMAIEEAARCGAPLPVTAEVNERYAELQKRGGGRLDTSSLILALRDASMARDAG